VKFTLIIFLCSFINNECLPPQEIKQHYNSWKECTLAALEISKEIIRFNGPCNVGGYNTSRTPGFSDDDSTRINGP
jgi:hypothetical protein